MKAFVTGGTGFIGRQLIRQLVERGYTVHALARGQAGQEQVRQLGAIPVLGDITERESLREAMTGSDVVFHVAAWYKVGAADTQLAERINVTGTLNVLGLAHELRVPKIIYTSTVAVFGDTHGQLVDEEFYANGPFLTEYDRTKWLAHYHVAVPLIQQGAPIVIVMPGGVYGPGDTSQIGELMRRFYLRQPPFPVLPAPSTTLTFAHVEDIAHGHILAAERGRIGQSYILAGPAVPLGEMVDFWARLTGKRPPMFHVPAGLLRPTAPLMGLLNKVVQLPELFSAEATAIAGATYIARADRARAELGWQPRSLQRGMLEALGHIAAEATEHPMPISREREYATLALGAAAVLAAVWWFFGRKKRR